MAALSITDTGKKVRWAVDPGEFFAELGEALEVPGDALEELGEDLGLCGVEVVST